MLLWFIPCLHTRWHHWRSRHYQPLKYWIFSGTELLLSFRESRFFVRAWVWFFQYLGPPIILQRYMYNKSTINKSFYLSKLNSLIINIKATQTFVMIHKTSTMQKPWPQNPRNDQDNITSFRKYYRQVLHFTMFAIIFGRPLRSTFCLAFKRFLEI